MSGIFRIGGASSAWESARTSSFGAVANREDREKNYLDNLQTAVRRVRASSSPKQRAAEKIARLLRRLQELKARLANASPAEAKVLARELGSIAGQLAGAAQAAASASGGGADGLSEAAGGVAGATVAADTMPERGGQAAESVVASVEAAPSESGQITGEQSEGASAATSGAAASTEDGGGAAFVRCSKEGR